MTIARLSIWYYQEKLLPRGDIRKRKVKRYGTNNDFDSL
jgi:hypothetical protein